MGTIVLYPATDISYLNILFRFLGTNIFVFVTKIQYSPWPIMWNTNKHLVLAMLHVHKSNLGHKTRQIGNQDWNRQRRRFKSKLYDKRNVSTFPIVNSPLTNSNIPSSPAYGVYISQLIRYSRAYAQYSDFQERTQLLTQNLLQQGYVASRLKSSHQKFYGRHHNVVDHYELAISQMTMALLHFK